VRRLVPFRGGTANQEQARPGKWLAAVGFFWPKSAIGNMEKVQNIHQMASCFALSVGRIALRLVPVREFVWLPDRLINP
jgi:hypothetical protein